MRKKVLFASITVLNLFLLAACSGSNEKVNEVDNGNNDSEVSASQTKSSEKTTTAMALTPKEAIDNYASALEKGDVETALTFVIDQRRQGQGKILSSMSLDDLREYAQELKAAEVSRDCQTKNPIDGALCEYTLKMKLESKEILIDQSVIFFNGYWYMVD